MKKVFLTLAVIATTFFAAEAQSKKSKSKSKKSKANPEAVLKSDIAKIQEEKKLQREEKLNTFLYEDSVRKDTEQMEEMQKETDRAAWKEEKLKEVEMTNQEKWKKQSEVKEQWYASDRSQNAINKAAKLNDNQGQKVKAINESYNERAKAIKENEMLTDAETKMQLASLNIERREKIKAVIGKNKAERLEKERMAYIQKNPDTGDAKWMNEVAASDKKKKKNK